MTDQTPFIVAVIAIVLTGLGTFFIFILRDSYVKLGGLGALEQRVVNLEGKTARHQEQGEALVRIDQQMKSMASQIDHLTALVTSALTRPHQ